MKFGKDVKKHLADKLLYIDYLFTFLGLYNVWKMLSIMANVEKTYFENL